MAFSQWLVDAMEQTISDRKAVIAIKEQSGRRGLHLFMALAPDLWQGDRLPHSA